MDVFELAARINLDGKAFSQSLKDAENKFANLGKKLGSWAKKTTLIATGAATAALGVVIKNSVQAYAQYQQLEGGIQTIFGKNAQKVLENSEQAFMTAGISMNEYMETAIQTGAALISSLGGDQSRAAQLMDMSIIDMADNVNKMGTNMEAVQNAYRGFARGNFTMLDNLALGYAGTKEGMEKLLKDAEKIAAKQGKQVKFSIDSYADIVQAIHLVQEEMGIAGTTKDEAEGTLTGSFNMMKAAWQDMLVAMADPKGDIKKATAKLTDSAKKVAKNALPVIKNAIKGFGTFFKEIAPIIGKELPSLIAEFVPQFLSAGWEFIKGLGQGIAEAVAEIQWPSWDQVKEAVETGWNAIVSGVEGLAKVIFGANVDGSIKWPTWDDIGGAISSAWNWIIDRVNDLGEVIFGKNVDGSIKWPTWDDIGGALSSAWNWIIDQVNALGEVVFGTNVDGSIKWPTWDDIGGALSSAWNWIIDQVNALGEIVFGTNVDGSIKWPTWDDIGGAISSAWNWIIDQVNALGEIVFGTNVDGSIKWPTWDDIGGAISSAWNWIIDQVNALGEVIFGTNVDGSIKWPTWDDIGGAISSAWNWIIDQVNALGEVVFGTNVDGSIKWPTWDDIGGSISSAWNWIIMQVKALPKLVFGENEDGSIALPDKDEIIRKVENWWNGEDGTGGIKDSITSVCKWVLDLFDINYTEADVQTRISNWWNGIKEKIGKVIDITLDMFGFPSKDDVEGTGIGVIDTIITSIKSVAQWFWDNPAIAEFLGTTLVSLIAGFKVAKTVDNAIKFFKEFKKLNGLKFGASGWIGAIATIITLIASNWDTIEPALQELGAWAQETLQPILDVIEKINQVMSDIAHWLGIYDKKRFYADAEQEYRRIEYAHRMIQDGEEGDALYNDLEYLTQFTAEDLSKALGISVEDAEDELAKLKKQLDDLTSSGYEVQVHISVGDITQTGYGNAQTYEPSKGHYEGIEGANYDGGTFAKGEWDVPYDQTAQIHRGERILTASQVRQQDSADSRGWQSLLGEIHGLRNDLQNVKLMVGQKVFGQTVVDYSGRRMNKYIGGVENAAIAGYGWR